MNPRTYRKRPVLIEAAGPITTYHDARAVADWIVVHGGTAEPERNGIAVLTAEGTMIARFGDYVIRGVAGEFYPCKPDIFAATYDAATGDDVGGPTTVVKSMENEIQHLRHHLRRIASEVQEALEEA